MREEVKTVQHNQETRVTSDQVTRQVSLATAFLVRAFSGEIYNVVIFSPYIDVSDVFLKFGKLYFTA